MRRLARRRNILTAFFAIMGRLGKGSQSTTRPIFRVHYRKLVDEYSQQEQLKFMPALPNYMSYCCCRCGHTQKLKVSSIWNQYHANLKFMQRSCPLHFFVFSLSNRSLNNSFSSSGIISVSKRLQISVPTDLICIRWSGYRSDFMA